MTAKSKARVIKILFVISLVALLLIEVLRATLDFDDQIYLLLSRFAGGAACLLFMVDFSFTRVLFPLGNKKILLLLLTIPGFLIAINNFPFVSYLAGDCKITASAESIALYALICLGVGFFEELAFRGCAFMLVLKNRTQSRGKIFLAIFLSSVVFGLIHFVNFFFGASIFSVALQICYSALIGALCSMVLLLTRNIWLCVILHATYNFCGGIIESYGSGTQWTLPEIIFTTVMAIIVGVYFLVVFLRMPTSLARDLFLSDIAHNKEAE